MHWADARFLHLLWALLPLGWLLWYQAGRRERRLRLLLDDEAAARLAPDRSRARVRAKTLLWFLACALAIVALARPQWGSRWQEVRRTGLDILVVLDTSNSMRAADLKPSRLQQAKWGLAEFVGRLSGDRVGLVVFAGSSFLACPLTVDYGAFSMMLEDVRPGVVARGGTALAQALETALESFPAKGEADRVIVLVTDGEDHEGSIDRAIGSLRQRNVRVFAIGIGAPGGEPIPAAAGEREPYLKDRSGNVVRTALREEPLEKLALATGGLYVRAAADDFGLDRVFSRGIAKLGRDERESQLVKVSEERFPWFLGAAALLLALESLVAERRRRGEGESR